MLEGTLFFTEHSKCFPSTCLTGPQIEGNVSLRASTMAGKVPSMPCLHCSLQNSPVTHGSPTPRLVPVGRLLGTGWQSRRWAAVERAKLHLYLQPLPITCITAWAPPPVGSAAALDSHRSTNPTVNCACKGSRLRAPPENLMPEDLGWSWGSNISAGEQRQIQIIISREVWLHRDHNKSIACRLISKPYQWVASDN